MLMSTGMLFLLVSLSILRYYNNHVVTIENETCCFFARDMNILIKSDNAVLKNLDFGNLPAESDNKKRYIRIKTKEKLSITLNFNYDYGKNGQANLKVASFDNSTDFKSSNLTIGFEEKETIYLIIKYSKSGVDHKDIYKLNIDTNTWILI